MAPREPGVLKRAVLWLLFLGPFFFASYGLANWLTSQRGDVGSLVFDWERGMPLWPWTILPYWSIDLLYGLSLLLPRDKRELDTHCLRLLSAQVLSVTCFLLFPLRFTFERPELGGVFGWLFDVLMGFDKPYNQAPSLHIALLVVLWVCYARYASGAWRWLLHGWFALIGLSVLTTWQHHFIDIPTGALLGLFALWLFPRDGALPFAGAHFTSDPGARRLAGFYGLGAAILLACATFGAFRSALWLALLWPALALAIVSFGYATRNPNVFQKGGDGGVTLASRLLLWPYRAGAAINVWAWTRSLPAQVEIVDKVFLGRYPTAAEANRFATVIDLAAEFEKPSGAACDWKSFPMLDLLSPSPAQRATASNAVEAARSAGPVLVCCALGFQRSAGVVAEWLAATGRARDLSQAGAILAATGRPVHLRAADPPATG